VGFWGKINKFLLLFVIIGVIMSRKKDQEGRTFESIFSELVVYGFDLVMLLTLFKFLSDHGGDFAEAFKKLF
jgi:hypothetical protein